MAPDSSISSSSSSSTSPSERDDCHLNPPPFAVIMPPCKWPLLRVLAAAFVSSLLFNRCPGAFVGLNYGTQFSASPSPQQVVNLLRAQSITYLRLFDANASILQALAHTGIQVMVTVPNTQLLSVGESNSSAANWVKNNVVAYLPNTNITAICVGTEVLTSDPNAALVLLPAMKFLYSALQAANLTQQVKISSSHDPALILDSFPPSQAYFNKSWDSILLPMLDFLSNTSSFFMLNIYAYDIYKASNGVITLDYSLLNPVTPAEVVTDSNTLYQYKNLFDAVLDSGFFALVQSNHSDIPIVVSATGWPSAGDSSDTDATDDNASIYNSNLIAHVVNNSGTPKRPRATINTYLFELFNEDLSVGAPTMKNYGLFNASTLQPVYKLRLSGSGPLLANDTTTQLFCVAKSGADVDSLQIALDWACGAGRANCTAIQPGQLCYEPDTVQAHASYAFNNYYQANDRMPGSCDFNGVATVSTTNPSTSVCVYSGSSNLTTNGTTNGTTSANSTSGSGNTTNSSAMDQCNISCMHILFSLTSLILVMTVTAHF